MRIWEHVDPTLLCDKHLLAEHKELHQIFSTCINNPTDKNNDNIPWINHPEVKRWREKFPRYISGLAYRHRLLVVAMRARGFQHRTPIVISRSLFEQYLDIYFHKWPDDVDADADTVSIDSISRLKQLFLVYYQPPEILSRQQQIDLLKEKSDQLKNCDCGQRLERGTLI